MVATIAMLAQVKLRKQKSFWPTHVTGLLQQPKFTFTLKIYAFLSWPNIAKIFILVTQLGSPITLANLKLIASIGSPEPTSQWQPVEAPGS